MLGATCPRPHEQLWNAYSAWEDASGPDTKSYLMPPTDWDEDYTALFNMTGAGGFFTDKMVLNENGDYDSPAEIEGQGLAISKDWTINYPTTRYTRSVGLVSPPNYA